MKLLRLLPLLLLCVGCHSPSQWTQYPGAHKINHCAEYASWCAADLTRQGTEAYYIEYAWFYQGNRGRHAVVLFQQKNHWFVVDNVDPWPQHVEGKTPADKVRSAFPYVTTVDLVRVIDSEGFTIKQIKP